MIGIDGVSGGRVNTQETQGPEKKTFLGRQVDAGTGQEPKAQKETSRPSVVDRAKSVFSFEVDHTSSINAGFDKNLGHEDRYQAVFSVVKDRYASGSEKMRAFKAMSEMGMDNECPKDLKEKIVHTLITASQEDRGNLLLDLVHWALLRFSVHLLKLREVLAQQLELQMQPLKWLV